MTSQAHVKQLIDAAERRYTELFEILCSIKSRTGNRLRDFQPLLGSVLRDLSRAHSEIVGVRQDLIRKKHRLSVKWFVSRQRTLAQSQQIIRETILIGRSLGDAFAWLWYQNQPELLERHLEQEPQVYFPTEVGGVGELEFVKRFPVFNGFLILHHGITSMLRIGDISLIDVDSHRVVAFGELKTLSATETHVENLVALVGVDDTILKGWRAGAKKKDFSSPGSEKIREKLDRQVLRMVKNIQPVCADKAVKITLGENLHVRILSQLMRQASSMRMASTAVGGGLVLAVVQHRERSLYNRLRRQHFTPPNSEEIAKFVVSAWETSLPSSVQNRLIPGLLHYGVRLPIVVPGVKPLFWWNLSTEHIRKILFMEVAALSFYNPAHLLDKLLKQGFRLTPSADDSEVTMMRSFGEIQVEIPTLQFYEDLIQYYLFSEEQICTLINEVVESSYKAAQENPDARKVKLRYRFP